MRKVIVVGLGNIGSFLIALLARLPGLEWVVLIDFDRYTEANLSSQAIAADAVGRLKVEVQAEYLRALDPSLTVQVIADRVENVPLGVFRDAVAICAGDNRRVRQSINRMAWRCNAVWIDGAVQAPALGRVAVYRPSASGPCGECPWDDEAYESMEQQYACRPGEPLAAATAAPPELGARVAALQIAELRKLMSPSRPPSSLTGAQYVLEGETYAGHLCRFTRNDRCRFGHEIWTIDTLDIDPDAASLVDLFEAFDDLADPVIRLEGHSFATFVDCVACGTRSSVGLSVAGRSSTAMRTCACGGTRLAPGFFSFESLRRADLSEAHLRRKLGSMGLGLGDVVSVAEASRTRDADGAKTSGASGERAATSRGAAGLVRHFEIGRPYAAREAQLENGHAK